MKSRYLASLRALGEKKVRWSGARSRLRRFQRGRAHLARPGPSGRPSLILWAVLRAQEAVQTFAAALGRHGAAYVDGNDLAALVTKKGAASTMSGRGNATLAALDARRPAGRVESATIEELKGKVDDLDKDLKSVAKGIAAAALRVDENFNKIHAQLAELKSMLEKIEK